MTHSAILLVSFIICFVAIFANNCVDCGWHKILKEIREKAKTKFRNAESGTVNFLGYDINEFPFNNEHSRKINREKWELYYECLRNLERSLTGSKSINPIAVAVLQGGFAKLECGICLSPDNVAGFSHIEWLSSLQDEEILTPIEMDEHTLITPEKTLLIYNVKLEQSGQYMCSLGQVLTAPYFLTIVHNFESQINTVHHKHAKHGPYPAEPVRIPGKGLIVTTRWGPWSKCGSQCGKVGKKHKYGYCNVILENGGGDNGADSKILATFPEGIPCSSHILPRSVRKLEEVESRKDEIMVAFCREKCSDEKVFEVRDEFGNVLEQANNSAGIYSMVQGLPPEEPNIEKSLEYFNAESDVVLVCPGNLNSDAPMQWQLGEKLVVPEIISKESGGRIYISITDRLHIKNAKVSDTNIYSCWQNGELAGIVRLVIERKLKLNFNHHLMMVTMILVLSTFFYVFTRAFFGRKYARIKE